MARNTRSKEDLRVPEPHIVNSHFSVDAYFEDAMGRPFEQTMFVCAADYRTAAGLIQQQLASIEGSRVDELNLQLLRGEMAEQELERSRGIAGVYFSTSPRELQQASSGFLVRFFKGMANLGGRRES